MLGNSKESLLLFLFVSVTQLPACLSLCFLGLCIILVAMGTSFARTGVTVRMISSCSIFSFLPLPFFSFGFFGGLLRLSGWDKIFFCCCTKEMVFDSIYRSVVINEMRIFSNIKFGIILDNILILFKYYFINGLILNTFFN